MSKPASAARALKKAEVVAAILLLFATPGGAADETPGPLSPLRLGLFHHELSPREREKLAVSETGAVITGVLPDSPADEAGIQPGDVIVQLDTADIADYPALVAALKTRDADTDLEVVVSRSGSRRKKTLRATEGDENPNVQLFKIAEAGEPWAQFGIGERYRIGSGTRPDPVKARYWLEKAAERGVAAAQWSLGAMAESGEGGAVNLKEALSWYEKAAQQDLAEAQYKVGAMYATGRGCGKNETTAASWYEKAASQKHTDAQYALAQMLQTGRGVKQDEEAALDFLKRAAGGGHLEAMATLGSFYASGKNVAPDPKAAVRLLTPAAEAGLARAQHELGALYYSGRGVARDHATAAQWMHKAAAQGYVASQAALGSMYLTAQPPDYAKAFEWLSKAAAKDNPQSLNALGQMYRNGWGVAKDERNAFEYQLRAAQAGNLSAQFNVGIAYLEGKVVSANHAEALKWLEPVIQADSPPESETRAKAHFALATIYDKGGGKVPPNRSRAMAEYEKAGKAGHVESQRVLGQMLREQKKYVESVTWLRKAAEKGDRAAQNDLGTAYALGQGVPKNRRNAIAWLLRAAEQGSPTAKESLKKLGVTAK
ncbi:MAG: PDZ domain-containing protein [Chthoniobacterales bacterium]